MYKILLLYPAERLTIMGRMLNPYLEVLYRGLQEGLGICFGLKNKFISNCCIF